MDDIGAEIGTKTRNLQTIFPNKFGSGGEQDLARYSDQPEKVGVIYRNLVREAKRAIKRQRR